MNYHSTRGGDRNSSFTDILMAGLAGDGGLYVPDKLPDYDWDMILSGGEYTDTAFHILRPFIGEAMSDDDLHDLLRHSYGEAFTDPDITPVHDLGNGLFVMDLFHGPTLAFKDVALQLLGHLLDYQLQRAGQQVTIIGATSGDTGSAAIEGCKHVKNARIVILHPHNRTSEVQRRQMTCVTAENVHNIAVQGSFDDCQSIVKTLFGRAEFRREHNLTAVNSINWARVMAQCVYYVRAVIKTGRRNLRFAVPTGNFGNIYAAHVMRQAGLPMGGLIIASNRNDILTRFFETGVMGLETVEPSLSPSMDIQISSNFERLLSEVMRPEELRRFMQEFHDTGNVQAKPEIMQDLRAAFTALRCDDQTTLDTIRDIHTQTGMILDPHSAVGVHAALQSGPSTDSPIMAMACAHPAKFPDAVQQAIGRKPDQPESLQRLFDLEERYIVLPPQAEAVEDFISRL